MLPIFQKIEANINHSYYVEHLKVKYFPNPLQFHPDIEIMLVINGTGTRFVGNSITRFSHGDVTILGENVPHLWSSDEQYLQENNNSFTEIIFILFKKETLGEQFWHLPESRMIFDLIKLSKKGISLKGDTKAKVTSLIKTVSNSFGFDRIILLFQILNTVVKNKEFDILDNSHNQNLFNESDSTRLNKIYQYVINNYQQDITLEKAAAISNLSISPFCRYFKKRTNKSFVQFLNEIRIAQACRLLDEDELTISSIGYTCGYSSISYFIKKFKEITGFTPLNYKKKLIKHLFPYD